MVPQGISNEGITAAARSTTRLWVALCVLAISAACSAAASAQQTLTCSSDDGKRHYCSADTSRGVQMTRQRSGSPCQQGSTWGYDRRGVWVDRGCRADFVLSSGRGQGYNNGRPGYNNGNNNGYNGNNWQGNRNVQSVTCSSDDGKRHYCSTNGGRNVQMVRQRSGSPCQQGSTWGSDRRGIWVDRGCRADFTVN